MEAGTPLYIRERGTKTWRDITIENKTVINLIKQIQVSLSTQGQVLSIIREDGSRIETDLDVCFVSAYQPLEIVFANKFYWVVTDEQRREWTQEFSSIVGLSPFMTGDQARLNFTASRIAIHDLAAIWELSDMDKDNHLSLVEFILGKFLICARLQGQTINPPLPQSLLDTLTQTPQVRVPTQHQLKSTAIRNPSVRERNIWTIPDAKYATYNQLFCESNEGGFVTGHIAFNLFSRSGIDRSILASIWEMSDLDKDSLLNTVEFKIAIHLICNFLKGIELPKTLPQELVSSAQNRLVIGNNTVNSWQQYPQPNHLLPQHPNIGHWNLPSSPSSYRPDYIQNVSAGIRVNLLQQQVANFPLNPGSPTPVTPSSTPVLGQLADVEHELTGSGVMKIDTNAIQRDAILGSGAFGKVWRGTWNGEIVAIKDVSYRSEKEVELWKREVTLLSYLQNANYLVRIKGYSVTPRYLTIIMEFMDGGSLYDIVHKDQKVNWSMLQKVRIMRHIAKALDSIHKLNIVHRDLKSMNILLDRVGIAKLADLGCSRMVRPETMTVGVGSPLWMAPEVANSSNYSFPSDIFSYGVVFFEIFNEKFPEYDTNVRRVIIPSDCIGYSIIKECTVIEPENRPTASQVIDSLDLLITTFTTAVAKVVINSYPGDAKNFPREDDVSTWYNILLKYDRETFDVLLTSGLPK